MKVIPSSAVRWIGILFLVSATPILAETPANPQDANVNAIRGLSTIGQLDQTKISDWITAELAIASQAAAANNLAPNPFHARFQAQLKNASNSPAFVTQLIAQAAAVAAQKFSQPNFDASTAQALAYELKSLKSIEALPGLLAGLKSAHDVVRAICAGGLGDKELKPLIASDAPTLKSVVSALQSAGPLEKNPIVLGRIYEALRHPAQVTQVLDAYLAIFDRRLNDRRGKVMASDGGEQSAFEFFSDPIVVKPLSQPQRISLVTRIAAFMHMESERYLTPNLNAEELERIGRLLSLAEEDVETTVGTAAQGGKIRDTLAATGHANRQAVVAEVLKWIGDAQNNTPGALNAAPWSVPVGAPWSPTATP